jgi:hypothetical protein
LLYLTSPYSYQLNFTEDQILTLAPDDASKKSGKGLATPAKWVKKGVNETALWGECQGSGNKPYQSVIDRTAIVFKCSCPSRKFPCKHGIGLALLYARQPHLFTTTEAPPWVTEWIGKRAQREEKSLDKKEKEIDEAAQTKRLQPREQKVKDGINELLLWIKDIIRNGIINIPDKEYKFWESMAKRMVDAQSPSLSGMIRRLAGTNFFKEGWQNEFLAQLLSIYLIAKGYQNKEGLSPHLLQDIRGWIGFTQSTEELKEQQGISDTWLVLGKQVSEEDNVTVERNWLYGINSNRYALVLQFIARGQGAQLLLSAGMYLQAEIVFYPSVVPIRALIKKQSAGTVSLPKTWLDNWKSIAEKEGASCAQMPVRSEHPYLIQQVTPVFYNDSWWLKDTNNALVSIKPNFKSIWNLLAISGGEAVDIAVVGKENHFEPIGVWHLQNYKAL